MRILYFSRDYTTHDHRFLSALAKTGHQVYFLQLERRGHVLEDRPLPAEVEAVAWTGGRSPAELGDGPRLLRGLREVLDHIQPDIVQAGPLQRSALLVALSGFQPLISMSWGYDLIHDAGRNALWRWATRYTLRHSTVMLGDCSTIRQLAISYGMPDERIVTFPWGVELERFTPLSDKSDRQTFTLLSTRGWEPIYGADVIAHAFVQAARQRADLRLVMLGNGSQAALLRQIFQQDGVQEQVLFPGQISQADLPRYYRSADLYISASHSDGTSISLLEAFASGLPALVSDIPGNREWVTSEQNGWLFPDGDADALAQGILHAVDQRQRMPEMGCVARRTAEQRADWAKNFPILLEVYAAIRQRSTKKTPIQ
jgi:glycosyltransferase involved in cell wall biosynthesis